MKPRSLARRLPARLKDPLVCCYQYLWYHWRFNRITWLYVRNRSARRHLLTNPIAPTSAMTHAVRDLTESGISTMHASSLTSTSELVNLLSTVEQAVGSDASQTRITAARARMRTGDAATRAENYQVKLWDSLEPATQADLVEFALREEFIGIASSYIGVSCHLSYVDVWCNLVSPGPPVLFQQWHRDRGDRKMVKLYVYVRDVGERTGPFCYAARSNRRDETYARAFPPWRPALPSATNLESVIGEGDEIVCTGEAGTMVLADTLGLHRGGHAVDTDRLIFYANYTSQVARSSDASYRYDRYLERDPSTMSPAQRHALGL